MSTSHQDQGVPVSLSESGKPRASPQGVGVSLTPLALPLSFPLPVAALGRVFG